MKKLLILLLLCTLCGCAAHAPSLADTVTATLADKSLPAGRLLCYGRGTDGTLTREIIFDYLGLAGYPDFTEKIEEMAVFSTLAGEFGEVCVLRLYDHDDLADAKALLSRRITAAARALAVFGKSPPPSALCSRGNTVALVMLPDPDSLAELLLK